MPSQGCHGMQKKLCHLHRWLLWYVCLLVGLKCTQCIEQVHVHCLVGFCLHWKQGCFFIVMFDKERPACEVWMQKHVEVVGQIVFQFVQESGMPDFCQMLEKCPGMQQSSTYVSLGPYWPDLQLYEFVQLWHVVFETRIGSAPFWLQFDRKALCFALF